MSPNDSVHTAHTARTRRSIPSRLHGPGSGRNTGTERDISGFADSLPHTLIRGISSLAVTTVCLISTPPLRADVSENEFRRGVLKAAERLETARISGSCTSVRSQLRYSEMTEQRLPPEKKKAYRDAYERAIQQYEERGSTDSETFHWDILGSMTRERGTPHNREEEYVMARNERYAFAIVRMPPGERYTVRWLEPRERFANSEHDVSAREGETRAFPLAPYYVHDIPLADLIDRPEFLLKSVRETTDDAGRRLVRVEFEYEGPTRTHQFHDAWLECDPEYDWTLTRYQVAIPPAAGFVEAGPMIQRITIESEQRADGLTAGKSLVMKNFAMDESEPFSTTRVTVDIDDEPPDPAVFYLSYYGLDEPTFQAPWYTSGWVLLVIGGIAATVGLVFLRRFQRRYR